jgi:enoyl-CoA hydratase/carnithine racemase
MNLEKSYQTFTLKSVGDHVLLITLNRPEVGNALNTQMGLELYDLWREITENSGQIRCAVLTGSGQKIFCAGGDLKERNGMTKDQWKRQHEIFERHYWEMTDLPIPLIAAVNGHAYAGGLEMALSCDFIYASRVARFALTEVTLGIMPGAGGTQNLPRAIGDRRAKEIILTGKPFSAENAYQWGLVNELFDADKVLEEALNTAKIIAGNAPLSARQVKKSIRYGSQMELKTAFRFEVESYNHLIDTSDRVEGVLAFNEKRPPIFKGS